MSDYPQLEPLQVSNLRKHIEQRLRNAILSGAFGPGDRLVESAIAEHLDVSRGPVREALAALEREGVVAHVPRKGYFVIDLTDKDVEEIYSLRLLLEIESLRRAGPKVTEEDLVEMQRIVDALGKAALEQSDVEIIVELDLAFHDYVCRLADHSRLYAAWRSMSVQARVLVGLTSKTHYDHPEEPKELHQSILEALRVRDGACAQEILIDHLQDAQRRAISAIDQLRKARQEKDE